MRAAIQRWLFRTAPSRPARWAGRGVGRLTQGRQVQAVPAPGARVVLIGGAAVGGAGRTAVVEALARRGLAAGRRVAIVGHGYRGQARGITRVDALDPVQFGDEAVALARALPGATVWVGPRAEAVRTARAQADLVLVDGGLLDLSVRPTGVIGLLDVTASRRVFPAGPNRVDPERLAVDLRWAHRVNEPGARPWAGAVVRSQVVARRVVDSSGVAHPAAWLRGRPVVPICGIARPQSFLHALAGLGARPVARLVRADHHRFDDAEAKPLPKDACWITTTKDAPRIPPSWPVAVLETDLHIETDAPEGLSRLLGWAWS